MRNSRKNTASKTIDVGAVEVATIITAELASRSRMKGETRSFKRAKGVEVEAEEGAEAAEAITKVRTRVGTGSRGKIPRPAALQSTSRLKSKMEDRESPKPSKI